MNTKLRTGLWGIASFGFSFATCVAAAPLSNISKQPLVLSQKAPPNIMVLFDTSGSMAHVLPSTSYDPNDPKWSVCPSKLELELSDSYNYSLFNYSDDAYIGTQKYNDNSEPANGILRVGQYNVVNSYYYSTSTSAKDIKVGGVTIAPGCFNPTTVYRTRLIAGGASMYYDPPLYSGHYLNYYFSTGRNNTSYNAKTGWITNASESTRMDVGQTAVTQLVNSLSAESVNLGLAAFDGSDGAEILNNVELLSSGKKTEITNTIKGLSVGGRTPLAESLSDIALYFVGSDSQQLTLHPGKGNETKARADKIFKSVVANGTGTTLKSPINADAFCAQNFTVVMTDGEPTNDQDISSYLQDYDGDCPGCPDDNYDRKTSPGYHYDAGVFETTSDYMDDVAQAAFEMDLAPSINDRDGKPYKNNMSTYMIGFGDITLKNNKLFTDTAAQGSAGGSAYFPQDTNSLIQAFDSIFTSIYDQVGTLAAVAFNSSQFRDESTVFQAKFKTTPWSGDVVAFDLDDTTGAIGAAVWNAGEKLDALPSPHTTRNVFTYNPDSGVRSGTSFSVDNWANLPSGLLADLAKGPTGPNVDIDGDSDIDSDDHAKALMNYLLGDETYEITNYRRRDLGAEYASGAPIRNRLGDITNSAPVFIGKPELAWPEYDATNASKKLFGSSTKSYSSFVKSNLTRDPVLYVGANDGMLHGFDGRTTSGNGGDELFAYVPSSIFSDEEVYGLHYLGHLSYLHRFYVDGSPVASDVFINNEWKTILVGSTGAGGRGIFALDVNDPSKYSNNNLTAKNTAASEIVLWEFTDKDDPDLGYTFSKPSIAMMANGKWAVIFGNGYITPTDKNLGSGTAQLFIVFIEEGVDGTWSTSDYVKIDTGVGNPLQPNGLSTPTVVDTNGDKVADRIYAGDLQGNMWVFDVQTPLGNSITINSNHNTTAWTVAGGKPLFSSSTTQPITVRPSVVRNPATSSVSTNDPNLLVLFGTGRLIDSDDPGNTDTQSYYAVWDKNVTGLNRSNLAPRGIARSAQGEIAASGSNMDWSSKYGWYYDLPKNGERILSTTTVIRDVGIMASSQLEASALCKSVGTSSLYAFDITSGLEPSDSVIDINNDGVIDEDDKGVGKDLDGPSGGGGGGGGGGGPNDPPKRPGLISDPRALGDNLYYGGSDDEDLRREELKLPAGPYEGRLNWQELILE